MGARNAPCQKLTQETGAGRGGSGRETGSTGLTPNHSLCSTPQSHPSKICLQPGCRPAFANPEDRLLSSSRVFPWTCRCIVPLGSALDPSGCSRSSCAPGPSPAHTTSPEHQGQSGCAGVTWNHKEPGKVFLHQGHKAEAATAPDSRRHRPSPALAGIPHAIPSPGGGCSSGSQQCVQERRPHTLKYIIAYIKYSILYIMYICAIKEMHNVDCVHFNTLLTMQQHTGPVSSLLGG